MDIVEIGLLALSVVLVIGGGSVAIAAARPLTGQIDEWRAAGLITAEQADALGSHYEETVAGDRRTRAAKALGILGGAAVGAGVILFFAANWSEIPRPLRVAILLVGLVAVYGAGFWLLEVRRSYRNVGHAFVFVGAILFGASVFLVGQMYHVQAHDPLGFLVWGGGALATALFFRSQPAAGLFVLTLEAWLIHEVIESADDDFNGIVLIPFILALYGMALYGLGTVADASLDRYRLSAAMRVVGFALAAFMVFALSFRYLYFPEREDPDDLALTIVIVLAAIALAAGALLVVRRAGLEQVLEGVTIVVATALVLLAVLAPEEGARGEFFGGDAEVYPLLFVALLVAVVVGAIVLGSLTERMWLVNGAIVVGALAVLAHFLDVAWNRLPRSLVFMAVGAVVLGLAAWLERAGGRTRPPATT